MTESSIREAGETPAAAAATAAPRGHGWWPYFVPYVSFMLLTELANRLPDSLAPLILLLKVVVPGAAILYYWHVQEAYPELREYEWGSWAMLDMAVGFGLAVVWVAPFVFFAELRPEPMEGFDPFMLGDDWATLVFSLRMVGYGLVTPFFEEIFVRGWAMRYAEVASERGDFRKVPVGRYSRVGFLTAFVLLMITHVPFEWIVMAPWAIASTLWLYYRKNLAAVVTLHATTNASILLFVAWATGRMPDPAGIGSIYLWYLV